MVTVEIGLQCNLVKSLIEQPTVPLTVKPLYCVQDHVTVCVCVCVRACVVYVRMCVCMCVCVERMCHGRATFPVSQQ